ncbi:MAG TPA: O-antigen ligase family protein [Nitrospira sp.]|nr:O-antigen ligase family protein [Nitrospira sp.]
MPPVLALIFTLFLIAFLFYRDQKGRWTPSPALVLPCLWLLLRGSRSVTEWLGLGPPPNGAEIVDGAPADRAVTFLLMGAGLIALLNRGIYWKKILSNNLALWLFFFYCVLSVSWSDFPFVAFKRWFKLFGDPIMVLVVLTDRDPLKALDIVLRTMVNILVPLSVLLIKYYPHLGKGYDEWSGAAVYTGVTTNKNLLGFVLMICGLSLVWRVYKRWGAKPGNRLDDVVIPLCLLGMVGWLFSLADSKTSLICFLIGTILFFVLGLSNIRRNLLTYFLLGVAAFIVLQSTMNLTGLIISSAGRDHTLTGRAELWEAVLSMQQHPLVGFGYESFWLGARRELLQERWYFAPNQAHSGYIELYLNLGLVGWLFFGCVLLSCYVKLRRLLTLGSHQDDWVVFGRLGMSYLFIYLLYNYTEAAFKSPHLLFFIFLIFAIEYVPQRAAKRAAVPTILRDSRGAQASRAPTLYPAR